MQTRTNAKQAVQRVREVQPQVECPTCESACIVDGRPCQTCKGEGTVSERTERWIRVGRMCRQVRENFRATIAETAFRLGGEWTMGSVARMEAGLMNPAPLYRHWFKGVA